MECQRFQKLIRNWYFQVQSEAMAPARMVLFMEKHLAECPVCLADTRVREEVQRITTFVLPEVKIRKASEDEKEDKVTKDRSEEDESEEEEEEEEEEEDEI